jgi:hypothetical protein
MSDDDFKPQDYVYIGRRQLKDGKIGHFIRRIDNTGELGKESGYVDLKKFRPVVGGVYTGATFSETHAKGIDSAKYNRQWPDVMHRLEWQALDRNTEAEIKRERIEKDARRTNEMDRILLPIRRAIYNANRRGDYAEAHAIRNVVQISLNKPLTASEEE